MISDFWYQKMPLCKLMKICLTFSALTENLVTLQSYMQNWLRYLSTNMVINHCTLSIQTCMIHHFNQNVTADTKMYRTWLYVKCTMVYDHICTQFWRSVSASGHGNVSLKNSRSGDPGSIPASPKEFFVQETPGDSRRLQETPGDSRRLPQTLRDFWRLSTTTGDYKRLLETL